MRSCVKCDAPVTRLTTSYCKSCNAEYARNAEANWNPQQRESRRLTKLRWKRANAERNRAHSLASYERHKPKRLTAARVHTNNYRARLYNASGSHTSAQFSEIVKAQDNKCFDCTEVMNPPTCGHLVPLSRSGSNDISNIVAQCKSCNCRQHTSIHLEAYRRGLVAA